MTVFRESEKELRRVMKTVNDSFAECRRAVSPTGSDTGAGAAAVRSSSVASENSSTTDLMEHFLSELDLVFNDILAEGVRPAIVWFYVVIVLLKQFVRNEGSKSIFFKKKRKKRESELINCRKRQNYRPAYIHSMCLYTVD